MSTSYPTGLDALTRPTAGDPLSSSNGKSQTVILDDVMDAVEAIEAKVGVNGSAVATSLDYAVTANTAAIASNTTAVTGAVMKVAGGASIEDLGAVESRVDTASVTGTKTADTSLYAVFDYTMTGATTFTFSNPAPAGKNSTFMLILRGAFTPTFPASVDWADAAAPAYATPSVFVFTTVDAGTTWLGSRVGKAFA